MLSPDFLSKKYVVDLSAACASDPACVTTDPLGPYVPPSVGVTLPEDLPADPQLYGAVAAAVEELVRHALLRGSPFGPVNGHVVKVGFASTCTGVFIDRDGGAADPDSDAARNLTAWLRNALSRSGVRYLVVQQLAEHTTGEVRILVVAGEPVHLIVTKPAGAAEGGRHGRDGPPSRRLGGGSKPRTTRTTP
jgi:hypothetical protein